MMSLKGSQAYINDMLEETKPEDEPSEIVQFFTGRNVFLTGGSGFLGKLLIEKLIRTCSGINKLYVLLRVKKGKSLEERVKETFSDPLFVKMKEENPNFLKKIVIIEGDMSLLDLGLSPENRKLLKDTDVIFHGAATVRFDETLRTAGHINVRGTKQMLLLAHEMPNLKAFVYISTAFSHCTSKTIREEFYKPPMSTDDLMTLIDMFDDEKLERMKTSLLGTWPNTYAFTKAIAEDAVRQYSKLVPSCVTRPSIVTPTMEDPVPGWIDNFYGATGIVAGATVGLLRTIHCNPDYTAEIIPGDYVVSNIIAAAWELATTQNIPASISDAEETPVYPCTSGVNIYNIVSSCQKPINWRDFMERCEYHGLKIPSLKVLWYYCFRLTRQKTLNSILVILLHYIPALIIDSLALLFRRKPRLYVMYKKVTRFSEVIGFFCSRQWSFNNDNVMHLWMKLSSADQRLFKFSLEDHVWDLYLFYAMSGIRVYLLKDPMETLPASKRRYARLKFAHYTLVVLFWFLVAYGAYSLISIFILW